MVRPTHWMTCSPCILLSAYFNEAQIVWMSSVFFAHVVSHLIIKWWKEVACEACRLRCAYRVYVRCRSSRLECVCDVQLMLHDTPIVREWRACACRARFLCMRCCLSLTCHDVLRSIFAQNARSGSRVHDMSSVIYMLCTFFAHAVSSR